MTPVAKTGLHCGRIDEPVASPANTQVTPVAKTGLHCGLSDAIRTGEVSVE